MARDPRYDILFESVQIGPKRTPNRFYQVPHCTGMGFAYPNAQAALRGMKAEGGWGVVSTHLCEIHHTADQQYYPYDRLWDDADIPAQVQLVEAIHAHSALAAVQLGHSGIGSRNFYSRAPSLGPSSLRGIQAMIPAQSRAMDKDDIKQVRGWYKAAAKRAKKAGFDILYVYAGHNITLPFHFLSRRYNTRTDEYGGSLENRARLLKEILLDTKDVAGDECAVAIRFAVDELMGDNGLSCNAEGRDVVEMLAELPDLWDVNVSDWWNDSQSSRFSTEGFQEEYISFVKKVTSKPVVGVGRFTSPDTMVSQIKRGILDLIGAARPSIADPFLPKKIDEGRIDEIRECIGCNVCASSERYGVPIRCTQNPSMGEEFRKGWHPERMRPRGSDSKVLVVGSGPAGLECAMSLGKRGYDVALAEAGRELGGRVLKESRVNGFSEWIRVRDYRVQAIEKLPNVEIYRESRLGADEVFDLGFDHIVVATGATWRSDGVGGSVHRAIPGFAQARVFTPDDMFAGTDIPGPVLVYDDDHYYLASAFCEMLRKQGKEVIIVTPLVEVSMWTFYTLEQRLIQRGLLRSGVTVRAAKRLAGVTDGKATLECIYTGEKEIIPFTSILSVTARNPTDDLYQTLIARKSEFTDRKVKSLTRIGDCLAPATIAAAVYSGREFAENLDSVRNDDTPFVRERVALM